MVHYPDKSLNWLYSSNEMSLKLISNFLLVQVTLLHWLTSFAIREDGGIQIFLHGIRYFSILHWVDLRLYTKIDHLLFDYSHLQRIPKPYYHLGKNWQASKHRTFRQGKLKCLWIISVWYVFLSSLLCLNGEMKYVNDN